MSEKYFYKAVDDLILVIFPKFKAEFEKLKLIYDKLNNIN